MTTEPYMFMNDDKKIEKSIEIKASVELVWDVLTNPKFAKTLGNIFDENAFLESDWELGSLVHFKYSSGRVVATGKITNYKLNSHIHVDYKEINYSDRYSIIGQKGKSILKIKSGPYPQDYEAQLEVRDSWLLKVKELSEV